MRATLLWNGPLGAFELPPFDRGTVAAARHAAERTKAGKLVSIAGGGDTVAALNHAQCGGRFQLHFHSRRRLPRILRGQSAAGRGSIKGEVTGRGLAPFPRARGRCKRRTNFAGFPALRAEQPMNLAELNKVAEAMVAPGKGILAADESTGTIKKRFDAHRHREHRRQSPRLSRTDVPHDRGDVETHLRRHPLRRDHLAEGQGRHAAGRYHQEGRRHPRHQGRRRHQAAAELSRANSSPSVSTSSPTASPNITSRARASRNGAR